MLETKNGKDIKIKTETKCLSCKNKKAWLNYHKLTHDGVFVLNYICVCGEETIIYRRIKWL